MSLLRTALTHRSYAHERGIESYERLELLGDSIVGFITTEYLLSKYPQWDEGRLSKLKAQIVSTVNLAKSAKAVPLVPMMGRGQQVTEGILADVFEATAGAIYLVRGIDAARKFVIGHISLNPETVDYRTMLQERCQVYRQPLPEYVVVAESGPQHHRVFTVQVYALGMTAQAVGNTIKSAAQLAASHLC